MISFPGVYLARGTCQVYDGGMARPPNPETIAALKKRIEKLEGLVLDLLEHPIIADPPRLAALIVELNDALGMSPGTLEGRIEDALNRKPAG